MNYYNSAEGPAESVKPLQSAYDRLRSDFQLTGPEKYGNDLMSEGANPIYDAINSIQPGTPNSLADLKAKVEELKQSGIPGNTPIDPSLAEPLYNLFSQKAEGVR